MATLSSMTGDTATSWHSVEYHGTSITGKGVPPHKAICTSQRDMSCSISAIHHGGATNTISITTINVKDGTASEHICKQLTCIEALGAKPKILHTCSQVQDKVPMDNDEVQAGNFSSDTKVGDITAAKRVHKEQEDVLTTCTGYECMTMAKSHGCAEVRVGWFDELPRWRKGSELTYIVCVESFPTSLSDKVEDAMQDAIKQWQGDGFVSFRQVRRNDPATFAVMYQHWDGKPYACSFFPNDPLRNLMVFARSAQFPEYLVNILAHEIGHILGLRHEFADENENEKKYHSIQIKEKNTQSVMSYFEHPKELQVQKTDLDGLRSFYEMEEKVYDGLRIRTINPEENLFSPSFSNRLVSSVNSAAIDGQHLPIYPYLHWLAVNTRMQQKLDITFLLLFLLCMIVMLFVLKRFGIGL